MKAFYKLKTYLRPEGREVFISRLAERSKILDVGCGNNSPYNTKSILSTCIYTGIDVGDFNQRKPNLADFYILSNAEDFANTVKKQGKRFDAVISCHNIEHVNDREATLQAMMDCVKDGGSIFLSFPCEESIDFPKRRGTLNYRDDITHKRNPPCFDDLLASLRDNGFQIQYATRRYRPGILMALGLISEPVSMLMGRTLPGTWEFWGFESIVVAKKI